MFVLASGACAPESQKLSASGSTIDDGGPKPGRLAAATVELEPTTFEPEKVTVKVGDTVRWKWAGGVQHNVNGNEAFESELQPDGEFSHTFDRAGTYAYICDVHPTTMKGTVEVEGADDY